MKCPICDSDYEKSGVAGLNLCPKCGCDAVFEMKIKKLSYSFFNKGLEQAKSGNKTGAIESLTKSVGFYKKNVDARNLLALVYYDIGLMGEALKHWVLSIAERKSGNAASYYLDIFQKSGRQLEKYADSLRMYNSALNYIRQKSEDMAIIQLKKALEYNENFVDAMTLLCFCYLVSKQRNKAFPLVEQALSIDRGNVMAGRYYYELTKGKDLLSKTPKSTGLYDAKPKSYSLYSSANESSPKFPISQLVCLFIGAAVLFGIMNFYVLPSRMKNNENDAESRIAVLEEKIVSFEQQILDKEAEILQLDDENEKLNDKYNKLKTENDTLRDIEGLLTSITEKQNSGDHLAAMTDLHRISVGGLSDSVAQRVTDMKQTSRNAIINIANAAYEDGRTAFNANNYTSAIVDLKKAIDHILPEFESYIGNNTGGVYIGDIYYLYARSLQNLNENAEAYPYFKIVADNYPEAAYYSRAVEELANLAQYASQ